MISLSQSLIVLNPVAYRVYVYDPIDGEHKHLFWLHRPGSWFTTFLPPMESITDISDFWSLSGSSVGSLSR